MTGRGMGDEAARLQPCRAAGQGVPTMPRTMRASPKHPRPRRALALLWLLALAGLAAGCGGGGDDAPEAAQADVVVRPLECAGRAGVCS